MGILCLRRVRAVLVVGVLVVAGCSGGASDGVQEREGVGAGPSAVGVANSEYLRTRGLLEEQIGVDGVLLVEGLIADRVDLMFPYARWRTFWDLVAEEGRRLGNLGGLTDDELADFVFDAEVRSVLSAADEARSGDIAEGSDRLHEAFVAAVEECASGYGIKRFADLMGPSVEDLSGQFAGEPDEDLQRLAAEQRQAAREFDRFAASLGMTRDELLDVRHSCSRYAAGFPTLAAGERDHLVGLLYQHYLEAVHGWLAENPQAQSLTGPVTVPGPGPEPGVPEATGLSGDVVSSHTEADAAGSAVSAESGDDSSGGAAAHRRGPLRLAPEDGVVDLGFRYWPDHFAPTEFKDEVAVRVDSVLVRDGALRGVVQNMSQDLFARRVSVSVGDSSWSFPLTVQPTEAVPFVIDGYDRPAVPGTTEFEVSADLTREPDPGRSLHFTGFPGHWAEPWDALKAKFPDDTPPAGTIGSDLVFFFTTVVEARPASSHPGIAEDAANQTIDELRVYLTTLDIHGRVVDVRELVPYIETYAGTGDGGGLSIVPTPVNRLPFEGHTEFFVSFLTDRSTSFALTGGGAHHNAG